MNIFGKTYRVPAMLCLMSALLFMGIPASAQPAKVAVTPFAVTAKPELSYLGFGLIDLFSSRLFMKDKVTIVEKSAVIEAFGGPSADPLARLLETGKKTRAQYVVTGSLEFAQGIVILKTFVLDMNTGKTVLELSEKGGQNDPANAVIPLVDLTAAKINKTLFARETVTSDEPKAPVTALDVHSHPDKLIPPDPEKKK